MSQDERNSTESDQCHQAVGNDENDSPDVGGISSSSPCKTTQHPALDEMKGGRKEKCSITKNSSIGSGGVINNCDIVRHNISKEICKGVIRCKLMKLRHLIIKEGINPLYLKEIFPAILRDFKPQHVTYNGGIANITTWKISCYLEVMDHGIPTTEPNLLLKEHCLPLLNKCNDLFLFWYQQQHKNSIQSRVGSTGSTITSIRCRRLMTFITRYTPAPNEQALLKHIDGAGKVDGSVVVALPIDEWSAPYEVNEFMGGGLTFWDGPKNAATISCSSHSNDSDILTSATSQMTNEIHYDTRSGDIAFIDRAVWHQADPITKGTRWALVIFYKIEI